jgi:chitin synthase
LPSLCPAPLSTYVVSQFANVHDVSWGTKGDNKVQTDLGTVQAAGKNKNEVEVVVPTEQKDINAAYEDALHVLQQKPPKVEQKRDAPPNKRITIAHSGRMCYLFGR